MIIGIGSTAPSGISRVGVGAVASSNSSSSLVMDLPTSLSNNDYLVAIMGHIDGTAEPTTPSGWTRIGNGVGWSGGDPAISVYGRVRDGSEGSTLTVNLSTANRVIGFIAAYRTVSGDGFETTDKAFALDNCPTPSGTATANSCIIHIWAASGGVTVTLPNAGDLVASGYTPDGNYFLGAENQLSVSAGATTSRTANSSATPPWNVMQIELLKA